MFTQAEIITSRFPVTMQTSTLPLIFLTKGVAKSVCMAVGIEPASIPPDTEPEGVKKNVFVVCIAITFLLTCGYFALAPFVDREEVEDD